MLVLDYSGSMNDQNKITALKDAVSLFLAYLQEAGSQDRVGFAVYSTDALLAQSLTIDLNAVESQVRSRSADGWTNIGNGMELGRQDLLTNGRPRALRMMVLMTDGLANRPLGRDPQRYVRDEARLADASRIPIVTISFGRGADVALMDEVADLTGGVHFHVAGSVGQQEKQLRDVFQQVAARRPPALVD
jgi:Mg-chelatase subunit ChlD